MKKLIFILLFLPVCAFTQIQLGKAPGEIQDFQREEWALSGEREIIWSENFSSGIPAGWLNEEQNGIAHWEWRGPSTIPNTEVGTRGSCLPPDVLGTPIMSSSPSTGFVIFDSNWWDNPDLPCSPDNFGTGSAPGPHLAMLTTPTLDLSGYAGVGLIFRQYMKMYEGETRVEVSVNGGFWTTVFVNQEIPNPTLPDDEQFVQLSSIAGGQSDVRIRFVFDGNYYFWMLDDIELIETSINDLSITESHYGDFDLFDVSHPTGFEFLEYSKYPDEMPPMLKFSSQVSNFGAMAQNDSRLNVEVLDNADNVIHVAQSDEGMIIPPGASMELRAGSFTMPGVQSNYRVTFETSQTEEDEILSNNFDTAYFNINDVQYARDRYYTSAVYIPSPEYALMPFEIGNVFLITQDNMNAHSISVAVAIGSSTPANIYGSIYEFDISQSIEATFIASTNAIEITSDMFNGSGDEIITNLNFPASVPLDQGSAYLVTVGCDQGPEFFVCALSGDAEEYTSYVHFPPSEWFLVDRIPMVRLNFGFYDNVEEVETQIQTKTFPNPFYGELNIDVSQFMHEEIEMRILDQSGRVVFSSFMNQNHAQSEKFDLSKLSAGIYDLVLSSKLKSAHSQIIRE